MPASDTLKPPVTEEPFDLQRFVAAQAPVIATVMEELRSGEKRSHWMWFVFPQLRGLGRSSAAHYYGIPSLQQAEDYLTHSVLGPRLEQCTALVCGVEGRRAEEIFGPVDALKFRSSMTLFSRAKHGGSLFEDALAKFYNGQPDPVTLSLINDQR